MFERGEFMIQEILVPVMAVIAKEVTKEITNKIRRDKPVNIDVKEFQNRIEKSLKDSLDQYDKKINYQIIQGEKRIDYLEKAIQVLFLTVNNINEYSESQCIEKKNKLILVPPKNSLSDTVIKNLISENTNVVFIENKDSKINEGLRMFADNKKYEVDEWLNTVRGEHKYE